jgi:HPt (histidine-containing phosphotransfer) domain-containing protein
VTEEDEIEREIAALRDAYRAELPAKVEAISKAIAARDAETTRTLAHRLRGTAGSYGLSVVSAAAGALEDAGADWAKLESLLPALTAAAGR